MSYEWFNVLHQKLENGIKQVMQAAVERRRQQRKNNGGKRGKGNFRRKSGFGYRPPPVPNGHILTSVRLACAIRYFAGGSAYDLMGKYGISHSEVMNSVWYVIEAINLVEEFFMSYPSDHQQQKKIADGFRKASGVGFDNCAGAIDGILIWMQRPSVKDAQKSGIGVKKLFCGRKHKFGLNCQAVSDRRGRFLDVSIKLGGASADCLAFEATCSQG